jgi:hypothetical protein
VRLVSASAFLTETQIYVAIAIRTFVSEFDCHPVNFQCFSRQANDLKNCIKIVVDRLSQVIKFGRDRIILNYYDNI